MIKEIILEEIINKIIKDIINIIKIKNHTIINITKSNIAIQEINRIIIIKEIKEFMIIISITINSTNYQFNKIKFITYNHNIKTNTNNIIIKETINHIINNIISHIISNKFKDN